MAYTYLDITNEVLNRFNEVELTSSGFGNARGFQIQCKNAVNDAINYISKYINHSTNVNFTQEMKNEFCKNIIKCTY